MNPKPPLSATIPILALQWAFRTSDYSLGRALSKIEVDENTLHRANTAPEFSPHWREDSINWLMADEMHLNHWTVEYQFFFDDKYKFSLMGPTYLLCLRI